MFYNISLYLFSVFLLVFAAGCLHFRWTAGH